MSGRRARRARIGPYATDESRRRRGGQARKGPARRVRALINRLLEHRSTWDACCNAHLRAAPGRLVSALLALPQVALRCSLLACPAGSVAARFATAPKWFGALLGGRVPRGGDQARPGAVAGARLDPQLLARVTHRASSCAPRRAHLTTLAPDIDEIQRIKAALWDDASPLNAELKTLSASLVEAANATIVAEGDSWFDYPPGMDILDCLKKYYDYRIIRHADAGDTLLNMA